MNIEVKITNLFFISSTSHSNYQIKYLLVIICLFCTEKEKINLKFFFLQFFEI
jgi:hypothetical protein